MNRVRLIYQSGDASITIPDEVGVPSAGQLTGSTIENLCEFAGRLCYGSIGAHKSRPSPEYHQHIVSSGHLSIYEHAVVAFNGDAGSQEHINRPGVWSYGGQVHANLRSLLEWSKWGSGGQDMADAILRGVSPLLVSCPGPTFPSAPPERGRQWLSFWIETDRGVTHELVRHRHQVAISQRSTRYCDESESPWHTSPALTETLHKTSWALQDAISRAVVAGRQAYRVVYAELYGLLREMGCSVSYARKQARGAARGYLGNALRTSLVMSASVSQWRHIVEIRTTKHADAGIRDVCMKIGEHLP